MEMEEGKETGRVGDLICFVQTTGNLISGHDFRVSTASSVTVKSNFIRLVNLFLLRGWLISRTEPSQHRPMAR